MPSGPARDDSRLRVAVDSTPLLGPRTGVGHVTANLLAALAPRPDVVVVGYAVSNAARELADQLPAGVRPAPARLPARLVLPWWQRAPFPRIEHWTGSVDVVHATNYTAPPARAPVVITIHDLTYLHRPELVSDTARRLIGGLVEVGLDRGATVHVVSDFVGDEVRAAYGLPAERVVRVYPGLASTTGGDARAGHSLAGTDRYVLALGQLEPRKNLPTLVRAFDEVAGRDPTIHLVIAGPDGWGHDAFDAARRAAHHGDRVRWLGFVSDDDRRTLLAGATCFAYPSLYEGFGHPPLEAMAAGIPVVAASSGAIPEIVGDAALLVDPLDTAALAQAVTRALDDADLRDQLRDAGYGRAAQFDWRTAADAFISLYRTVATRA